MKIERKSLKLEVKSVSDEGLIEGYLSKYGNIDSYGDIVQAGAFTNTLANHKAAGTMPKLLWQHEPDKPIGVWYEYEDRTDGLFMRGKLNLETQRGREAFSDLKFGSLDGLSIGFYTKRYSIDTMTGYRYLTEVELIEGSVVTFQANQPSTVTSVKSGSRNSEADKARIMDAIRNLLQCLDAPDQDILLNSLTSSTETESPLIVLVRSADAELRKIEFKAVEAPKIDLLAIFKQAYQTGAAQ